MHFDIDWSKLYHARQLVRIQFPSIWRIPLVKKEIDLIEKFLKPNIRVLEIGAGDRKLLDKIQAKVSEVHYKSFDIDRSSYHDFYKLDDVNGEFDLILGFEIIEHMSPSEGLMMVSKLKSVLAKGGSIVLGTPNLYHPHRYFGDLTHVTPYKYEELGSILVLAGYEVKAFYRKFNSSFFSRLLRIYVLVWLHKILDIDFANTIFVEARNN